MKNERLLIQALSDFVGKALLLALFLIATATHALAHDVETHDFIKMKTPYRHLLASPLPTTSGGDVDGEKMIIEASMTRQPDLTPEMDWYLSMAIDAIKAEDDYAVELYWSDFIRSIKNNLIPMDIDSMILWALRESYIETNRDLSYFASKVKHFNEVKKSLRDELNEVSRLWEVKECEETPPGTGGGSFDAVCENMGGLILALQDQLQVADEDSTLANTELQLLLDDAQQQPQVLMSNMAKLIHEATMNIVRKVGDDDD